MSEWTARTELAGRIETLDRDIERFGRMADESEAAARRDREQAAQIRRVRDEYAAIASVVDACSSTAAGLAGVRDTALRAVNEWAKVQAKLIARG